jgi:hypothetical protein
MDKHQLDILYLTVLVLMRRAGVSEIEIPMQETEEAMDYYCPNGDVIHFDTFMDTDTRVLSVKILSELPS